MSCDDLLMVMMAKKRPKNVKKSKTSHTLSLFLSKCVSERERGEGERERAEKLL